MMSDLLKIHQTFLEKVKELSTIHNEVANHAKTIKNLPEGKKGDTPIIDYNKIIKAVAPMVQKAAEPIPVDESAIVERVLRRVPKTEQKAPTVTVNEDKIAAKVLKLIPKTAPVAPEIDHDKLAELVVSKIKEKKILKTEHIAGLDAGLKVMSNQVAGKVYGKDTWARGGGDTVVAGTNITFSRDANGNKVINTPGGAGTIYNDAVTGTINSINKTFTVPNTISTAIILILANSSYQAGVDYTVSGTTITMTTAPDISLSGQPFFLVHT